ncbi:MAG: O-methyltransferase [Bacteroidales bacterium]
MESGQFYSNDLEEYILAHTTKEDEVLNQLNRHTHLTALQARMLSGPMQGKLLEFLCRMIKPAKVLEIGTFTGYSAICMVRGLPPNAHLHTIERNDEIVETAESFFKKAGLTDRITLHVGNAIDIVPNLSEQFDLVLIDGDKREYPEYLEVVLPSVPVGGFIIADNVLWSGKVLDNKADDDYTQGVKSFNQKVANDNKLEQVMLPLRDGLMLIRKLAD